MSESAEPPAKRVKTEGEGGGGSSGGASTVATSSKQVEAVVLAECKKHQQWLAPPVLFRYISFPDPVLQADERLRCHCVHPPNCCFNPTEKK